MTPTRPPLATRRRRRFWLGWLVCLCWSGLLPGQVPAITLACEDKADFPNVLGDSREVDWTRPGASIEFVKLLTEELGLQLAIQRLPWKRALELELKDGSVDGLFPVSYAKEREAFGVLPMKDGKADETRSMFASAYSFYKLRTAPLDWDGQTLRHLTGAIGASRGYSIVNDLRRLGYKVEESDDVRKDLQRLRQGWLGAIAALESAEDHLLEASPEFSGIVVKLQPPISRKAYYVMLSRQFVARNPELAQRIWDKSRELRERELPRLLRKYLGK